MRKRYEIPEMEVALFNAENDIVTASGNGNGLINGGSGGEWNEDLDDLFKG